MNMLTRCFALLAAASLAIPASAESSNRFGSSTKLSGAQEIAAEPVVTEGSANATITFKRDFSSATVRVNFSNLSGAFTRLHLHCNVAGANGPIAIGLIDLIAPQNDNSDVFTLTNRSVTGTFTNADFPENDPCLDAVGQPINNVVSLAAAIDAGLVYWNLHTEAFPPGELRGQVRPLIATEDK